MGDCHHPLMIEGVCASCGYPRHHDRRRVRDVRLRDVVMIITIIVVMFIALLVVGIASGNGPVSY